MKLFNLEKFINGKVTKRTESMFLNDIKFYDSSLKEKTEEYRRCHMKAKKVDKTPIKDRPTWDL